MIEITDKIVISEDELVFKTSRSSGPGGQNVNKVNTRVTALFDVANCRSFSNAQKDQILKRLATRATKDGRIQVVSQRYRSQKANRRAAIERLQSVLRAAIETKPARKKTKAPAAARQRRLEEKKRRSTLKRQRAKKKLSADDVEQW